ncbi:hypothetical protein, partial [Citrobacter youngae]
VQVEAGRDAVQVHAAAASAGFLADPNSMLSRDLPRGLQQFGGGSVMVRAGRDVVSGQLLASNGIDVAAAGSVRSQLDASVPVDIDPG